MNAWTHALKPPFDPWIERVEKEGCDTEFALRSTALDSAINAHEAHATGRRLLERLNGALLASQAEGVVNAGGILNFSFDGKIHRTVMAELNIRLRGVTATGVGVALGPDGKILPPPPPTPSDAQRWANAADSNDLIADLLVHFGRSDGDWYETYKTLEVAEELGKRHGGYKRLISSDAKRVENLRRTANMHRHSRPGLSGKPPAKPTTVDDARPLLNWVVRVVMAAAVPRS